MYLKNVEEAPHLSQEGAWGGTTPYLPNWREVADS